MFAPVLAAIVLGDEINATSPSESIFLVILGKVAVHLTKAIGNTGLDCHNLAQEQNQCRLSENRN